MIKYAHTNIIAKDCLKLINFYKDVFNCISIGQTRDLSGDWVDRLTGLKNAHIVGEHLLFPGYDDNRPTLEIFSYDDMAGGSEQKINQYGFAHIAFEVDDVEETLKRILAAGGGQVGELITTVYEDGRKAKIVYTRDIEGNIVELLNWS
jgi:glyoxylase I family protein